MNTGQKAEEYVRKYFQEKKSIDLIKAPKGELGYDFRSKDSKIFVEVKGSAAKDFSNVLFRYFTNTEYEKARSCRKLKQRYEIHLVVGVDTESISHFVIPGKILLEKSKPEISWNLPIRKELKIYMVK
ncbi:MAG: DUF3883 domain-containing protein [Bacteroidota bacterium]